MKYFAILRHKITFNSKYHFIFLNKLQTFDEHEYLDGYTTTLGLGGIVNMEKIYQVQSVLEKLSDYHQHYFERKAYEAK